MPSKMISKKQHAANMKWWNAPQGSSGVKLPKAIAKSYDALFDQLTPVPRQDLLDLRDKNKLPVWVVVKYCDGPPQKVLLLDIEKRAKTYKGDLGIKTYRPTKLYRANVDKIDDFDVIDQVIKVCEPMVIPDLRVLDPLTGKLTK